MLSERVIICRRLLTSQELSPRCCSWARRSTVAMMVALTTLAESKCRAELSPQYRPVLASQTESP
ncbi:hypothetical protein ACFQZC_33880 [Streptacidiphilus monticola]